MNPVRPERGSFSRLPHGPPRRLFALLLGWEPIPESVSLFGGRPDVFLLEPVTGAAVAYDDCWVLIDTGFNPQVVRDPELRAAHYTYANYTAIVPPGDPLVDQVGAAGLRWEDLAFSRFRICIATTAVAFGCSSMGRRW